MSFGNIPRSSIFNTVKRISRWDNFNFDNIIVQFCARLGSITVINNSVARKRRCNVPEIVPYISSLFFDAAAKVDANSCKSS